MKHVEELIQAYLAEELDADRAAAVKQHLAGCSRCRRAADRTRELWELVDSVATVPSAGGSVWPAVRARTVDRNADSRPWFFGNGPWMQRGLAAAAVAAGLVVGVLLPAGSGEWAGTASAETDSAWLVESSWLSDSSWLSTGESSGLDDILLGADLEEEGNGS